MKRHIAILLAVILAFGATAAEKRLAANGKALYSIAIPSNPHSTERRAAAELADYLRRITGCEFKIAEESADAKGSAIYVGQTAFAKWKGVDFQTFAPEEWLMRTTSEGNLILCGGKYVGTYYAVVDFLERQAGVRWLDETCEIVPENKTLTTGDWNLRRKPSFIVRQVFDMLDWEPASGRFKERNKGFSYTQQETGVSKYFGGNRPYHTFGDYASDWPRDKAELYTRDANGKPLVPQPGGEGDGQLCLSNPEVRQRVLAKLRMYIERDRKQALEKKIAAPLLYDISANDNPHKCTCEGCMALAEREGSYAGATIDFINEIARGIAKDYPEIVIRTFAYMFSEKLPKQLKAEPNVMMHLALFGVEGGGSYGKYDTMRSLAHPCNDYTLNIFKEWGKHASHIMRWQYWTLYPPVPEPVTRAGAFLEDIEVDRECHVEGFFAEYENPSFHNFSALARYLAYKLCDDIDRDKDALVKEFMDGYYGAASSEMTALLDYMEKRQNAFPLPIGYLEQGWRNYLDDEYFETVMGLLSEAEEAVRGNTACVERVRRERPPILAGLLSRWPMLRNRQKYDTATLIEEFRRETYKSMDYFFGKDSQNFRKSQGFDSLVEKLCDSFRAECTDDSGILPEGVSLAPGDGSISLAASRFLYEAKGKLVDDKDGFHGKTCIYEYGNDPLTLVLNNWMEGINHARINLTPDILPRDGKYHWLKVCRMKFINNGRSHILIPPHQKGIRCEFYRRVSPGSEYTIYISLKCDDKAIYSDRILLVP